MTMKNISKIILGAVAILSFAACQNKAEFKTYPYARLLSYSYTAVENEGAIKIPVTINKHGETSVTFVVEDLTAVSGADYNITPADGVLTFSTDTVEYITVTPVDKSGTFTGDKNFYICLKSATNGYTIGSYYDATINIKDTDDPRGAFLGTWTADIVDYWGDGYTLNPTIVADPDDDTYTKVIVGNLDPYFQGYGYVYTKGYNYVSATMNTERTQLVAENEQAVGYSTCIFVGFDNASADAAEDNLDIYFNINADGTLTIPYAWGIYQPGGGWWCLYDGPITLTKE